MTDPHADALQAVAAALLFGRDGIGQAAARTNGTELRTYTGLTVSVSDGARDLLAEAVETIGEHGIALGMFDDLPLTSRDLARAIAAHGEA